MIFTLLCASLLASTPRAGADDNLVYIQYLMDYIDLMYGSTHYFQYDFQSVLPPYLQGQQDVVLSEGFELLPGTSVAHPDDKTSIFTMNLKPNGAIGIMSNSKGYRTYLNGCHIRFEYKVTKGENTVEMTPTWLWVSPCKSFVLNNGTGDHQIPYAFQNQLLKALSKVLLERAQLYFSYSGPMDELKTNILDVQRMFRVAMFKST